MTLAEGKTRVYFLTGSDANSYKDASFLINLNIWSQRLLGMIMRKSGTWSADDTNNTGESFTELNLVANQGYLDIPAGTKAIRRVELALDGTNFYKAELINEHAITDSIKDQSKMASDFTTSKPRYALAGNRINFYPFGAVDVTKGCRIWFDRNAYKFTSGDLSSGTKEPGFDLEFHDALFTAVAWEWAKAKQKPIAKDLAGDLMGYFNDLGLNYSDKAVDEDMSMQAAYTNYN